MFTVNITVDSERVRHINPALNSQENIQEWLQQYVNMFIESLQLQDEDTMDLETARKAIHETISKEYSYELSY